MYLAKMIKKSLFWKYYFYVDLKFFFFLFHEKSTKKKYYAVDVRNSCNTTCSVSFCLAKKEKDIFSNFSIFAFFCSNIFFFYIFWCMENYKSILLLSLPLFTCPTFIPFSTLSLLPFSMGFRIINEALTSFQLKITILNNFCYPSSMSGFF